ncbi:MAG: U32 family peptidase [Clostridia bacterium]|nr:U32 family peptidase [Clostridia bacterium]
MKKPIEKPELLCPAGSVSALDAAIEGGADAVYLGGVAMNARIHAGNFSPEALREAVRKTHAYGVKVYLTLNTLVTDRELPQFLDAAWDAAEAGVDALIVADAGGAMAIRRTIPSLELHASTQMSGHNSAMAEQLRAFGFSRMVAAREISKENLVRLLRKSPIETELFVHGALCVSHSGQCLFSSVVGGRSGNRGDCAQPCRLPYNGSYPLSLKDLSLAEHIPELISLGVASLKIEGRMKAPEYVRDVTRVFRRLLDENRPADAEEMRVLSDAFSRGGFTDGYYTGRLDRSMLGVRSEADKQNTREVFSFAGLAKKVDVSLFVSFRSDEPVKLSLTTKDRSVTVMGDVPQIARTAPLSREDLIRSLSRMGGTPYRVAEAQTDAEEGLMLPVSKLNDLRRRAIDALDAAAAPKGRERLPIEWRRPDGAREAVRSARFDSREQITPAALAYFERVYLPLFAFEAPANGVVMPPVIFDGDMDAVRAQLSETKRKGARWALVGNLGHLGLVLESGLEPVGDYRLNVTNRESAAICRDLGMKETLLSPELTLPQLRDVGGNTSVIVYGRLPLMTLERCVSQGLVGCDACREGKAVLKDRRGVSFPVLREWEHRNVVYNSLPTCMSDRLDDLLRNGIAARHFIFSVETPKEVDRVIDAFRKGLPLGEQVRRIPNRL